MDEITSRIQILDENTANQIAAGEVVERPASVVKELVENAIDAGATQITVELEDAGKSLIRVTDDGEGMSQADIIIALQRHATSKIRTADDLFMVRTMGFRGEALPSIASVAHVTVVARRRDSADDEAGSCVRVVDGAVEDVSQVGVRPGTSICVERLFHNVPARLKFLKSNATELSHIAEMVQRFALAQPAVALRLLNAGHEIFASRGSGLLLDAAVEVYGRDQARQLLPLDLDRGDIKIGGFVGSPQILRPTRAGQHTFVNRRFVRDRAIMRAIDDGYASVQTIHGAKHPPIVLLIDIDPSLVDVNVSPTKTEVRFTREREIFSAVYHAVADALVEKGGLVPSIISKLAPGGAAPPAQHALLDIPSRPPVTTRSPAPSDGWTYRPGPSQPEDMPFARQDAIPAPGDSDAPDAPPQVSAAPAPSEQERAAEPARQAVAEPSINRSPHRAQLSSLRILAQTRNMYILAQTDRCLCIIDQHIAHERVLYERFLKGQAAQALTVQRLIIPITLELGKREALVVGGRLAELKLAGFEIEAFGGETFLVRSAPAAAAKCRPEAVIRSIVDELVEKTASRKLLVPAEEVLITASCKMAVKAGDPLTFDEMEALIDDLLRCDNPYTCPHGRPIIIEMPDEELDRKFGRI